MIENNILHPFDKTEPATNRCMFTSREWSDLRSIPDYVSPELRARHLECQSSRFTQEQTKVDKNSTNNVMDDYKTKYALMNGCRPYSTDEIAKINSGELNPFTIRQNVDGLPFHYPINSSCMMNFTTSAELKKN